MDIPERDKNDIRNMSLAEFQQWRLNHHVQFTDYDLRYRSDSANSYSGKDDAFLAYLADREPEFLKELEKGADK